MANFLSPEIKFFLSLIEKELSHLHFGKNPRELYEPIDYTVALGGKRIRPLFLLMGCDLFGGKIKDAVSPALAIEIFHNFTLVHDDIMDNAPLRRNKPTVYKKWNKNIALLSGDVMLVWAYRLLSKCDKNKFTEILEVFNETAIKVCEGQQLDMNTAPLPPDLSRTESREGGSLNAQSKLRGRISSSLFTTGDDLNAYIEMITLKTAVLIAGSLKIGAILGGANGKNANYLYEFGKNIGIAFQLQDDLLDVFGDSEKFGKQAGGDIIENKKTFLLLKAFLLADGKTKEKLNHILLSEKILPEKKVDDVKKIYEELGVKEETEKTIKKFHSIALKQLSKINADENKKLSLISFVSKLMERDK